MPKHIIRRDGPTRAMIEENEKHEAAKLAMRVESSTESLAALHVLGKELQAAIDGSDKKALAVAVYAVLEKQSDIARAFYLIKELSKEN